MNEYGLPSLPAEFKDDWECAEDQIIDLYTFEQLKQCAREFTSDDYNYNDAWCHLTEEQVIARIHEELDGPDFSQREILIMGALISTGHTPAAPIIVKYALEQFPYSKIIQD